MKDRFLKRIRTWSSEEAAGQSLASLEPDSNELAISIRDDLEKMLNTRLGTVLIDPLYGLPDFNDMLSSYSTPDTEQLQKTILNMIKKYEKRLASMVLNAEDNRQSNKLMTMRLNASLEHKNQVLPFTAAITLNEDGSTSVSA